MVETTSHVAYMKCAHADCLCVVATGEGVERSNRLFCSDECADGLGCEHRLCPCGQTADADRYRRD